MMYIVQAKTVRKHETKVHIHLRAKNAKIHMEQQHAKRYTKGICTVYVLSKGNNMGTRVSTIWMKPFKKDIWYQLNQISMWWRFWFSVN